VAVSGFMTCSLGLFDTNLKASSNIISQYSIITRCKKKEVKRLAGKGSVLFSLFYFTITAPTIHECNSHR
jgi:hypothetical protein